MAKGFLFLEKFYMLVVCDCKSFARFKFGFFRNNFSDRRGGKFFREFTGIISQPMLLYDLINGIPRTEPRMGLISVPRRRPNIDRKDILHVTFFLAL